MRYPNLVNYIVVIFAGTMGQLLMNFQIGIDPPVYLTQPCLQFPRQFTLTNYPKTRVIPPSCLSYVQQWGSCFPGSVYPHPSPSSSVIVGKEWGGLSLPPSISLGVTPNSYSCSLVLDIHFAMLSTSTNTNTAFVMLSTSAATTTTDMSTASPTPMESLCITCHGQLSSSRLPTFLYFFMHWCPLPLPVRWAIFCVCFCTSFVHRLALDSLCRSIMVARFQSFNE